MRIPSSLTGKTKKKSPDGDEPANSKYRCVEVLPGDLDCCHAVQEILGQRFLSKQIPSLPLDDCDAPDCQCGYELLPDRRTQPRRVSDAVGNSTTLLFESHNRHRTSTGRREGD